MYQGTEDKMWTDDRLLEARNWMAFSSSLFMPFSFGMLKDARLKLPFSHV